MLAATRSKPLKWASDPQNKTWLNDDSRFGVKMLEKMGWKKGKGLGANEDGSTENVKVSLKSNQRGLGCSAEYENNWVAHQDDFQSLLNQLNSTTEATPAPETSKSIATLERKSSQQKRVHYAKFTRGKDLSNRSEQDMAAIFGTKPTTASAASSKSDDEEGAKMKKKKKKRKQEVEMSNTHTSQYSVDEYFKMRVAAKLNSGQTDVKQSTADNVEEKPLKRKKKRVDAEATCDVTEKPVKRKKRRDDVTNSSEPKSIKRKKTRVETTDCDVTRDRSGEVDSTNRDVTSGSEVKSKKDKKKKKKKKPAAAAE